jgi:SAM-dependent methyltransferase
VAHTGHGGGHYWSDLRLHDEWDAMWMGHPRVRAWINRRVSGDPAMWPIGCLRQVVPERLPLPRVLSVGCGVGNLERSLLELGFATEILGVDESAEAVAEAASRAAAAGFADRVEYRVEDARDTLARPERWDAVFFHASLHHFDRIGELLARVREALKPKGIVYVDEYIGPSRDEWSLPRLVRLTLEYWRLPRESRRARLVRAPISAEDPTEALQSSRIPAEVAARFRVLERRDYGGNLLFVIYPNLRRPGEPFESAVSTLMRREDELAGKGVPGYFSVIVAEREG